MEHIFDIDAVDIEAALDAMPEHIARQLRSSTMRDYARFYVLGNAMGNEGNSFSIREIHGSSICVKDTLRVAHLDILRSMIWRQNGVDYVFDGIEGCGEEVQDYGGSYVESWIEIHFTRKDA